jgi:hypothetical protein
MWPPYGVIHILFLSRSRCRYTRRLSLSEGEELLHHIADPMRCSSAGPGVAVPRMCLLPIGVLLAAVGCSVGLDRHKMHLFCQNFVRSNTD